jgi:hypothetical protein
MYLLAAATICARSVIDSELLFLCLRPDRKSLVTKKQLQDSQQCICTYNIFKNGRNNCRYMCVCFFFFAFLHTPLKLTFIYFLQSVANPTTLQMLHIDFIVFL